MYLAGLLNRSGLFQYFNGWKDASTGYDQDILEDLLFRGCSAFLNLERMEVYCETCLKQYYNHKNELNIKDQRIVFWSPTFVLLLNEFTPFLASLRIAQDLLWQSISRTQPCKDQAPNHLSDAMKNLSKYKINPHIHRLLTEYWNNGGKELKKYRDLDVHHYAIIRHSFFQASPDEKILIFLPDNPEEKNSNARKHATFKFERNAVPYFKDQFCKFHKCAEETAETLGYTKKPIGQFVGMNQLGELKGEKKTLALLIQFTNERYDVEVGRNENGTIYVTSLLSEAAKYLDEGNAFLQLGKYDEAIKAYNKAIEIDPQFANAWNNKGSALASLGKYDEAIFFYNIAIETNPKYADAWYCKGTILLNQDKHNEANQAFDKAIEIDPKYTNAWYNKGLALYDLNRYDEANQAFDKTIEIGPQYADVWYNKGLALCGLSRFDEANQAFDKAIEIDPKHIKAQHNKRLALKKLGRDTEAEEAFAKDTKRKTEISI